MTRAHADLSGDALIAASPDVSDDTAGATFSDGSVNRVYAPMTPAQEDYHVLKLRNAYFLNDAADIDRLSFNVAVMHGYEALERVMTRVLGGATMIATTTANWSLPEDAEHADEKAELWALLNHEVGADERNERALMTGTFDGNDMLSCAYGNALGDYDYETGWFDRFDDLRIAVSGIDHLNTLSGEGVFTPLELFVDDIKPGDTPATSPRAATVVRWIHEWQASR